VNVGILEIGFIIFCANAHHVSNILALETSVSSATLALKSENGLIQRGFESHRQQNQLLFAPLEELLESLEKSLDLILVGTGPASYSGSRIGIAAAHGIAAIHSCPVIGISSFHGIVKPRPFTVVGDARRGSYFYSVITESTLKPETTLCPKDELVAALQAQDSATVTLEQLNPLPVDAELGTPTAEALITAWERFSEEQQVALSKLPVEPQYLRAPFITKSRKGHPLLNKQK